MVGGVTVTDDAVRALEERRDEMIVKGGGGGGEMADRDSTSSRRPRTRRGRTRGREGGHQLRPRRAQVRNPIIILGGLPKNKVRSRIVSSFLAGYLFSFRYLRDRICKVQ